jgi:predicted ATP-dependent endonuclease of OLD family
MKLEWISIKNFRKIDELEFNVHDFTSLIGPNNASSKSPSSSFTPT